MQYKANTPEEYIEQIPEDRKPAFRKLRKTIKDNLPGGFEETISYGMIGYVVPHSIYPDGYHCDPKLPLPFMSIASQKNFVALYHSGVYADEKLLDWFTSEYPKHCSRKLDMGKSCIRFKKLEEIPFDLIGELSTKVTPDQWIERYEANVKNRKK
ncbi:MAG: DUF1801 domain-containing protein [Flavobacteriaceae bacterium]|nr:DUF1801 domain-containing protein [Bacteroidia bacterium]NNK88176.1 DUF1801 domain-containing protein [Flavobacteriaceae bacterium]